MTTSNQSEVKLTTKDHPMTDDKERLIELAERPWQPWERNNGEWRAKP